MILAAVLQAIGLFITTSIDDIIVLSLFFARGAANARDDHPAIAQYAPVRLGDSPASSVPLCW